MMGYDEPGRAPFRIPVSDTQAYRQFGNGVVVPVVRAVAQHMKPWLTGEAEQDLFCSANKVVGFG
jgi:DNA (cytosine-5)-methyltransferase 1